MTEPSNQYLAELCDHGYPIKRGTLATIAERLRQLDRLTDVLDRLRRIAHGHALFQGAAGDRDPIAGLAHVLLELDGYDGRNEALEQAVADRDEIIRFMAAACATSKVPVPIHSELLDTLTAITGVRLEAQR